MSSTQKIGELLKRLVPLSGHDVEEILHEQQHNGRRFGQIALGWGLCRPEHVWNAWAAQLSDGPRDGDLDDLGIDSQALACMSADLAIAFQAIPVRTMNNQLVVAVASSHVELAMRDLPEQLKKKVSFVLASGEQIRLALERYYHVATLTS